MVETVGHTDRERKQRRNKGISKGKKEVRHMLTWPQTKIEIYLNYCKATTFTFK